jgi:hypothetical protein
MHAFLLLELEVSAACELLCPAGQPAQVRRLALLPGPVTSRDPPPVEPCSTPLIVMSLMLTFCRSIDTKHLWALAPQLAVSMYYPRMKIDRRPACRLLVRLCMWALPIRSRASLLERTTDTISSTFIMWLVDSFNNS